jgi:ubiquinone/menaquinone biosynthesis C-methylase UbiE
MKIDLGSGYHKTKGFKTVDFRPEVEPDFLANLEEKDCLKRIKDNTVTEVRASHVFEHIVNIGDLMSEIYRVCKDGAKVIISTPYWSHHTAVEDPTHVRQYTERSMMYYSKDTIGSDSKPISIPYNFKQKSVVVTAEKEFKDLDIIKLMELAERNLNVIRTVTFTLKVVK